ncbi:MAG: type II toxin-antitoxin system RelE/ParE family toxin [Cyanobacteria bacterium CRU_2_1]|jgi:mRNA interferase RelE/StbE|nr:type II toxin-antitoxin system RelE/ParE family toxin [Cyanobacteria bacterium CRU_2_1]
MKIRFSRNANRFLDGLDESNRNRVQEKITLLQQSLENRQVVPFDELDVKKLKGEWKGFFRIRVGKIRIIFRIDLNANEILIYEIKFRRDAYD